MAELTRREFLRIASGGVAVSVLGPAGYPAGAAATRPGKLNVLFIAVDDLRPGLG